MTRAAQPGASLLLLDNNGSLSWTRPQPHMDGEFHGNTLTSTFLLNSCDVNVSRMMSLLPARLSSGTKLHWVEPPGRLRLHLTAKKRSKKKKS